MKSYRNNFKVSFIKRPSYKVNNENKSVKCRIVAIVNGPYISFPVEAVGYTKCSENDEFNAERGKAIAMARAENKIYSKAYNKISDIMVSCMEINEAGVCFLEKGDECIKHNELYIEKLSDPDNPDYIKDVIKKKKSKQ